MGTRKPAKAEAKARWVLYLPPSKRLALRRAALDEGVSASVLLERLVDDYLKRKGAK